ncbi:MAG: hypothetical protein ACHQF0_16425, partial [Chitinophagales bacterium]
MESISSSNSHFTQGNVGPADTNSVYKQLFQKEYLSVFHGLILWKIPYTSFIIKPKSYLMFTTFPPAVYAPNLGNFSSFEEKFTSVVDYLQINAVFCEVSNKQDLRFIIAPAGKLHVSEIIVPGGDTNYIKDILIEIYELLSRELTKYVHSDENYDSITEGVKALKEKSERAFGENNRTDQLTFENSFQYKVYDGRIWDDVPVQWLEFAPSVIHKLNDHIDLRKGFFNLLVKLFDRALQ